MAFDAKTERLISLKKLSGKAHTSNDKGLVNEGLPSGLTVSAATVFGQNIPVVPSTTLYGVTNDAIEYLRLSASFIAGSDTVDGRHGFSLHLPDDYESASSNPLAGTYPYLNRQSIYITSGALQLIPPSFSTTYEASVYHTGSGETAIPVLDARDWSLDYFNGIFFQQDPPGTGDHTSNPRYVDAHLFIGDYLGTTGNFTTITGSLTQLSDGKSYLVAGDNVTITSASNGQITIASSGGGGGSSSDTIGWVARNNEQIDTTGSLGVTGSLDVGEYIRHIGDSDTYIRFTDDNINLQAGGRDMIFLKEDGTQDAVIINDGGVDIDFRVESTSEPRALFVDANSNTFHVNYNESNFDTKIHSTNDIAVTVGSSGVILNEDGHASNDFRVESDGEDEAIFLDASSNTLYVNKGATSFTTVIKNNNEEAIRVGAAGVIINDYGHASNDLRVETDNNSHALFVNAGTDQVILHSSAAGGTDVSFHVSGSTGAASGIALFGGDTVVSGTLKVSSPGIGRDVIFYGEDSDAIGLQWDADSAEHGKLTLGQNNHGVDFQAYGETSGKYIKWDQSLDRLYVYGELMTKGDMLFDISSQGWDFTVNSNSRVGLFVDGGQDQVYILSGGTGTGATSPDPSNASDLAFFVSGSIGSKDSSAKGTAVFGGDVLASGTLFAPQGISGSLTRLTDGSSFLRAGNNVTIATGSDGSVLITADGTFSIDDDIVATLTGSIFSGPAKFNSGLTGSLTSLVDGRSYLSAGSNITITSASNGQITISSAGSGTPGGSSTNVQFNNAGSFGGDSDFTFNSATNTLTVPKLSGSLTRLASGLSYLVGGENVTVTTSSSGQVTIESAASTIATTRNKNSYVVTGTHAALAGFDVANTNFALGDYEANLIDVVYNGMILYSGTQAQVSAGNADYTISSAAQLKFGFQLSIDDVIHTNIITSGTVPTGSPSTAPYVTYLASSDLSAERVLAGTNGIVLDTSESGKLNLKIERIKTVYYVTASHAQAVPLTIEGASFNSGSYNEKRIDVYINGQLMVSGSTRDYELSGNETDVSVKFGLEEDDTIVVVVQ